MKRFLLWGFATFSILCCYESSASAFGVPAGIGCRNKRVGRVEGYWFQPTRGPLYDYSSYFATMYPWLNGAQEYQWQPQAPGAAFGTAVSVLPYTPPPKPQPKNDPNKKSNKAEIKPLPPK